MWRDTNTISELEFLAETILLEIVPNFKKDEVRLMCGTYGPFKPNKPVKVPLWLAIQFKKNKKCRIVPPIWLDLDFLSGKVDLEKDNDSLQDLPFYFFEIYQILFHKAQDDIDQLKTLRSVIEDLSAVRFAKINKHLETSKSENLILNLNNICARELEQIRPFITDVYSLKLEALNCK